MSDRITIAAILAAISTCEHHGDLARIITAAKRRRHALPTQKPSAAEVKKQFKVSDTVELFDLRSDALNGVQGKVVEVKQTRLIVDIPGAGKSDVPATCAVVVDGEPQNATEVKVFRKGDRFRIISGKSTGKEGYVIRGKGDRYIARVYQGQEYTVPVEIMEKLPKLPPNPKLLVMFKAEAGGRAPIGPVSVVDTTKADPKALRAFGEKVDGIEEHDWMDRSAAEALALSLGARFEAT